MGTKYSNPGPNFTPAYQISGVPFVTSSAGAHIDATPVQVEFPFVTRFFEITNTSDQVMRVGFSVNGINGRAEAEDTSNTKNHYLILSGGVTTGRLELRCKELFFRAEVNAKKVGFSLIAGLTGIKQFPPLTGTFQTTASFKGIG